jgi:endonuclease YncB( thermonuclease family)
MGVHSVRGRACSRSWFEATAYPANVRAVCAAFSRRSGIVRAMRVRPAALLLLALLQLAAAPLPATTRVLSVVDGDSLWVLTHDGARVEVRLSDIDSPERNQPYGARARRELADLVDRKSVRLDTDGVDRYGRTLARVHVGAVDVNAELVRRGAAWVYRKYSHDESLAALEKAARAEKRGLWALPASQRVPPWKWRHSHSQR